MISHEDALKFAREWIEAWNSHDLSKILPHYAEDFALTTPYIAEFMKEPTGAIKGKKAARDYWEMTFRRVPDLHLELIDCFPSVRSMVVLYRTMLDRRAAEWLLFDDDHKVKRSIAHYI
ncbi:MAG TPA: nuclear transport factor 2 family protein [Desulfomonilia bacterium]|nr:nuclear transport factor 2 family protein [Desulfomonilia bacterium]